MEFENKKLRSVAEAAARIMMGEKALHPNQQKLDVHEPEKDKLTSHDFKKLRSMKKEEIEDVSEMDYGGGKNPNAGHGLSHDDDDDGKKELTAKVAKGGNVVKSALDILNKQYVNKKDVKKEEVDLDEGKMAQLSADLRDLSHDDFHKEYGKPKSHFDPTNFKKPVQPGKEMDRAKALAQRGMAYMRKEEVGHEEDLEEGILDGIKNSFYDALIKKAKEKIPAQHHKDYDFESMRSMDGTNKLVAKAKAAGHLKSLTQRAMAYMRKEEVETLDELSKSTLGSYIKKAKVHMLKGGVGGVISTLQNNDDGVEQGNKLVKRRASGINKAVDRLTKEQVETLDEMFPGTPEYEKKYGKAPQDMKPGEKKKTTKGEMEKTEKGVVHKRKFSEMVESYTEGGVKGLFKTLAEEPTSAEFDAQLDDAKKRAAGTKKQPEVSKPAVQAVQNEEVELTLEDFTPEELEEFMQTEEYEQLDELSKATLGSYVKKASKDLVGLTRMNTELDTWKKNDDGYKKYAHKDPKIRQPRIVSPFPPSAKKLLDKSTLKTKNRTAGIGKAVDRMTKEGVESFEEQTHTTVEFIDYNDVNGVKYTEIDLAERKLTAAETEKKEDTVKGMKKNLSGFKERYGKDAKSVMYATATARAKGE